MHVLSPAAAVRFVSSNWPASHAVHVDFSALVVDPSPHDSHAPALVALVAAFE